MDTVTQSRAELLRDRYDIAWAEQRQHEDSPDLARHLMARHVLRLIAENIEIHGSARVLDIGSGPRPVEKHMSRIAKRDIGQRLELLVEKKKVQMVSTDIARLHPSTLRVTSDLGKNHATANSVNLPFRSGSFDIVFANMSFDMLGVDSADYMSGLNEVSRVLHGEGIFVANLHHAELFTALSRRFGARSDALLEQAYFDHRTENPFFASREHIHQVFGRSALGFQDAQLRTEGSEKWWEITALPTLWS